MSWRNGKEAEWFVCCGDRSRTEDVRAVRNKLSGLSCHLGHVMSVFVLLLRAMSGFVSDQPFVARICVNAHDPCYH